MEIPAYGTGMTLIDVGTKAAVEGGPSYWGKSGKPK
jgi:hypothetical protein